MFNNNNFKFNDNPKSLFLIAMVVFCAGLFAVNVGAAALLIAVNKQLTAILI